MTTITSTSLSRQTWGASCARIRVAIPWNDRLLPHRQAPLTERGPIADEWLLVWRFKRLLPAVAMVVIEIERARSGRVRGRTAQQHHQRQQQDVGADRPSSHQRPKVQGAEAAASGSSKPAIFFSFLLVYEDTRSTTRICISSNSSENLPSIINMCSVVSVGSFAWLVTGGLVVIALTERILYRGSALADRLEQRLVLDVVGVVGLHFSRQTGQRALQRVLGRGVDHLSLGSSVSMWVVKRSRR